jgi:starch phosphorylase
LTDTDDPRLAVTPEALERAVLEHLRYSQAKDLSSATPRDLYLAVSYTVRDRLVDRWIRTQRSYADHDPKRVYYLSAEYLLGRQLEANLLNLGAFDAMQQALAARGIALSDVLDAEEDPGLGNGGLGRLAACFMDSLATLDLPAVGYGIRYEFGIFRQGIDKGWQVEHPDEWLRNGNPWELARPERKVVVSFGGVVEHGVTLDGQYEPRWFPAETVIGLPYDTPVAGFGGSTVNNLRLWAAMASEAFDLAVFNDGDYRRAVEGKADSESISKVLYPKDDSYEGKQLRLKQQYFFVACSIHDLVERYRKAHRDWAAFPDKVAIQLNDTHPAIAVAELMRVLVDTHRVPWDQAWTLTRQATAYTNHTLLPEALETWSLELFGALLPRHLQIIREIDRRFLREVQISHPTDAALRRRVAIVGDGQVRMAHLATVGAHKVNGVAELHSELLRQRVLSDFAGLHPDRFTNVTNGVTPRRWLLQCNRRLADAITSRIGDGWVTDLDQLEQLQPLVDDADWHEQLASIKRRNKERLAGIVEQRTGARLDPSMLFDVQVKRIHEYKRQLMLCLYVVHLYVRARFHDEPPPPRAVLFGGKAAPGYAVAKQHIKLIHDVAATLANDRTLRNRLQLVFLPNYNVSFAERIVPGTDLSEQISMAGKEASGTGNMKFQMNGALTLGTLDGANIEIREAVGADNFFAFGLDAAGVRRVRSEGYDPAEAIEADPALQEVLELLESGFFEPTAVAVHREIAHYLRTSDPYLVCADFADYRRAQEQAAATYADPARWWPKVAANIAAAGRFSSDRSIRDYSDRIWGLSAVL